MTVPTRLIRYTIKQTANLKRVSCKSENRPVMSHFVSKKNWKSLNKSVFHSTPYAIFLDAIKIKSDLEVKRQPIRPNVSL